MEEKSFGGKTMIASIFPILLEITSLLLLKENGTQLDVEVPFPNYVASFQFPSGVIGMQ